MSNVALIVIYNHQYNKNIPIVEKVYGDRFSSIFHLVPFYEGSQENVIPVYENSYYFQGYIAQAMKKIVGDYDHYFFIADDLILNPEINQNNYKELLKLDEDSCFFTEFIHFHKRKINWPRVNEAFHWKANVSGIEVEDKIPKLSQARETFNSMNIEIKPLKAKQLSKIDSIRDLGRLILKASIYEKIKFIKIFTSRIWGALYDLPYPMVGGYSDIFVVNSKSIRKFSHYCGVFAATGLHVEVAIPTALTLSAKKIIFEHEIAYKGKALWPDGWGSLTSPEKYSAGDYDVLLKYNFNLKQLLNDFPEKYLYLHPIKLSKWGADF